MLLRSHQSSMPFALSFLFHAEAGLEFSFNHGARCVHRCPSKAFLMGKSFHSLQSCGLSHCHQEGLCSDLSASQSFDKITFLVPLLFYQTHRQGTLRRDILCPRAVALKHWDCLCTQSACPLLKMAQKFKSTTAREPK